MICRDQSIKHYSFSNFAIAALSWLAEYILRPVFKSSITFPGRCSIAIMKAIRQLITDKEADSEGPQAQVKVT